MFAVATLGLSVRPSLRGSYVKPASGADSGIPTEGESESVVDSGPEASESPRSVQSSFIAPSVHSLTGLAFSDVETFHLPTNDVLCDVETEVEDVLDDAQHAVMPPPAQAASAASSAPVVPAPVEDSTQQADAQAPPQDSPMNAVSADEELSNIVNWENMSCDP